MHRGKDGHLTIEAGGPAGSGSSDFFGAATRAAGRSGGGAKAPEPSREVQDQQVRPLAGCDQATGRMYALSKNTHDAACMALELVLAPR